MSFGDPNNPYGPPQGQQQPGYPPQQPPAQQGYGYPQGAPQQQPGYGYPQAPPVQQAYGAGAPMTAMPGSVSAARIMLWVIVGLQAIGVVLMALGAAAAKDLQDSATAQESSALQDALGDSQGVLWGYAAFGVAWAIFAVVLATKFKSGGNGARVTILVFAIITAVLGIYPFILVGLAHTVLAILVAVFVGNANGKAWFNRARY
ncbi:hypothetical protein [Streptomyces sp. AC550_RSS872]|uniref:hypothetical protein n=1 Tax=Streptomyces sp. AC550_RSS872 TaxID=2823689 RepID=UPI001C26C559|nr:hypothetical protein [Streptomyces sp. AC550_RSS872]